MRLYGISTKCILITYVFSCPTGTKNLCGYLPLLHVAWKCAEWAVNMNDSSEKALMKVRDFPKPKWNIGIFSFDLTDVWDTLLKLEKIIIKYNIAMILWIYSWKDHLNTTKIISDTHNFYWMASNFLPWSRTRIRVKFGLLIMP